MIVIKSANSIIIGRIRAFEYNIYKSPRLLFSGLKIIVVNYLKIIFQQFGNYFFTGTYIPY